MKQVNLKLHKNQAIILNRDTIYIEPDVQLNQKKREQIVSWYNLWLDLPSVVEYDSDKALWEYIPDLSLRHERLI